MAQRKNEAIWIESRERWQIKVQQDGERPTFTSSTPGKKGKVEAEKKADKWLEQKTQRENVRFGKLWDEFLEDTKTNTSAGNYLKIEQIGRLWLLPKLKNKKVVKILPQDWQECIGNVFKKGLSKKSCQNVRGTITRFYSFARKCGINMQKPESLTIPVDAPVGEKRILQPEDIKKLFTIDYTTNYGKQEPAFFIYAWRFLVLTGLRRGELCGIKKEDIENGVVHVRRSITAEGKETGGKTVNAKRYFAITEHAQKVLDDQAAMLKSKGIISPWIFPDEYGNRLDPHHLYKKWQTYSKQHDIKCSLHEMRHTFISVAKADVPEQLLKGVVGHGVKMDTFGVYGHEIEGEMSRVAGLLDNIFDVLLK